MFNPSANAHLVSPLTDAETEIAAKEMYIKPAVLFAHANRKYVDPSIHNQTIGLVSFIPHPDAVPNKDGIFGFAKVRGVYGNEEDANQKAIELIKEVDSLNKIMHVRVGYPFPIMVPTETAKFVSDVNEVDIQCEAQKTISTFVRDATEKDKKEIEYIKERERQLLEDVAKTPEQRKAELDPLDDYIFKRKKLSDNLFVFVEHRKKLQEIKKVILQAKAECDQLEASNPEVLDAYCAKYEQVASETGITEAMDNMALMIKQYFVEKPDLDAIFSTDLV